MTPFLTRNQSDNVPATFILASCFLYTVVDRGVGNWGSCPGHQGAGAPKRESKVNWKLSSDGPPLRGHSLETIDPPLPVQFGQQVNQVQRISYDLQYTACNPNTQLSDSRTYYSWQYLK